LTTASPVERSEARRLVEAARVARLATVGADGQPHLVPVCYALLAGPPGDPAGDIVYTAVDHKPKRTVHLRRIANLTATGRACLLVDHYAEDWSTLWWVRLDGRGRVVADPVEAQRARRALAGRYPQYAQRVPAGPVLALDVTGWRSWSAAEFEGEQR
jgi:PPOX class probable F420-dependent enzyme